MKKDLKATKINEQSELTYSQFVRTDMLYFVPEEYSRILEIGCHVGSFRQFFSKPCEYWGVEPFKEAAAIAQTKLDKVLVNFYDKVADRIPDNYFNLIIANDVIEHMENPWEFLQSIKKKMTANASIILSVPNVRFFGNLKEVLIDKDWEYKNEGILDKTHLRFFTQKSLVRMLKGNGFEIEKMEKMNPLSVRKRHLLYYWLFRFMFGSDIKFVHIGVKAIIK